MKIQSTIYPENPLDFNKWANYIHTKAYKKELRERAFSHAKFQNSVGMAGFAIAENIADKFPELKDEEIESIIHEAHDANKAKEECKRDQ